MDVSVDTKLVGRWLARKRAPSPWKSGGRTVWTADSTLGDRKLCRVLRGESLIPSYGNFVTAINNICAGQSGKDANLKPSILTAARSRRGFPLNMHFPRREIWFVYSIPNCSTLLHSFKLHSPFPLLTRPVCSPHLHFFPPTEPHLRPHFDSDLRISIRSTRSSGWLPRFHSIRSPFLRLAFKLAIDLAHATVAITRVTFIYKTCATCCVSVAYLSFASNS